MIKATIRTNAGPAANDAGRHSSRPAVVPLREFRIAPAPSADERARALLARIVAGDEPAFDELYRLLSRRVYAFALRITGNTAMADEVMLDTLHEVWRSAGRFRHDAQVSTWVLGIARNKALLALRERPAEHADIGDFADTLDSGEPDGYALIAEAENREMIRRCLQALSADHRECLHLAFFEDLSMRQIASMLGIPEGTVKSRLWHAKSQLAARICATRRRSLPN
jgi:RNA polymerase sigma-70 factor (ECF subfamily)